MCAWFKRKKKDESPQEPRITPDFDAIDSLEKAIAMFEAGDLEQIHLFPLRFGGQDVPQNMLYVPLGVGAIKEHYDNMVEDLLRKEMVSSYDGNIEYKGKSFIPSKLHVVAEGKSSFKETIDIW